MGPAPHPGQLTRSRRNPQKISAPRVQRRTTRNRGGRPKLYNSVRPLAIGAFPCALPLRKRRAMLISTHGFTLGREMMTTFDNREKAFEEKFAHDAEITFRIAARRNRLLGLRSEEHTSELQSLMRISYAVFCLKK